MRDYAKIAPSFWNGPTGRQIRALGPEAQLIAIYLLSCPSASMIGLYYLPLPILCHETGSSIEGASKALRSLDEIGFCQYDAETEQVWVIEMAKWQIGEQLDERDKRVKAVRRVVNTLVNSPFINAFLDRYAEAYHLDEMKPLRRGIEAPSKPLRSQKQEQEQEQNQEQEVNTFCSERFSAAADGGSEILSELEKPASKKKSRKAREPRKPTTEGIGAVVITIPLANGTEAAVTEDRVAEWVKAYPAVDVRQQLAAIRQWSINNPTNRKTAAGIGRHITGWLNSQQNGSRALNRSCSGRDRSGAPLPAQRKTELRDRSIDGQPFREEYDIATGEVLQTFPHPFAKGGKS